MELHALTPIDEVNLRIAKIRSAMIQQNLDAILISDNANIYYVTGRVINGYVYLPPTVMSHISSDARLS